MINSLMIKLPINFDISEVMYKRNMNCISFTKDGITVFIGML